MEKVFRSNMFARILALFMAVILWLFVTGDKITRTTPLRKQYDVPLRVENIDPDYVITEIPASVDMTLEGLSDDFEDLPVQEIDAFIDLSGKEPGNHLIKVQGRPPRGLSLVLLEPEQVRVAIEEYHSGDFDLDIRITGEPADGWELRDFQVEPEEILIGAPESAFNKIDQVFIRLDISNMRLVQRLDLPPIITDEDGVPVDRLLVDPAFVEIRLEFGRVELVEESEEEEID